MGNVVASSPRDGELGYYGNRSRQLSLMGVGGREKPAERPRIRERERQIRERARAKETVRDRENKRDDETEKRKRRRRYRGRWRERQRNRDKDGDIQTLPRYSLSHAGSQGGECERGSHPRGPLPDPYIYLGILTLLPHASTQPNLAARLQSPLEMERKYTNFQE